MTLPITDDIADKLQALLLYDPSSPLIFSSGLFLFLFAGFLLFYSAMGRAHTARILYVVLFSLYFYYKSSGFYFLLLVFAARATTGSPTPSHAASGRAPGGGSWH